MGRLENELAALVTMSPAQLRAEWLRVHKAPAPKATPDLLTRGIAYRLQVQAHGGLNSDAKRKLKQLAQQVSRNGEITASPVIAVKPGTRLVRDWGGTSHHVLILDDGYLYQEQRYSSLSEIARQITGAKWSGPRFFGLVKRAPVAAHA
ncbi:MAG TPA: DUF2924 domain-containing protein [Sphingomicrobium sp.]